MGREVQKQSFPHETIEGDKYTQKWRTEDGVMHREDGPAIIFRDGMEVTYIWMKDGVMHRDHGMYTAVTCDMKTNTIIEKGWIYENGYHRLDGPAMIVYRSDKWRFEWYVDGKIHREDGPAQINIFLGDNGEFKNNGDFKNNGTSYYGFKGKLHLNYESYVAVKDLYYSIKTRNDAIMHIQTDNPIIRERCQDILDGKIHV